MERGRYRWVLAWAVLLLFAWLFVAPGHAQAPTMTSVCPPSAVSTPPASPSPSTSSSAGLGQPAPEQIVACVGAQSITGATFEHWANIARRSEDSSKRHRSNAGEVLKETMGYLISSDWVIGEAQDRHVDVSPTEAQHAFDRIRAQQFHKHREFEKFLKQSGETVADLLFRVRLNLLSERIQKRVLAGHHSARGKQRALERFVHGFRLKWEAQTYCEPGYAVQDCGHVQASL